MDWGWGAVWEGCVELPSSSFPGGASVPDRRAGLRGTLNSIFTWILEEQEFHVSITHLIPNLYFAFFSFH